MNATTKTARLAVLVSYLVALSSDIALADEMLSTYAGLATQGADVMAHVERWLTERDEAVTCRAEVLCEMGELEAA